MSFTLARRHPHISKMAQGVWITKILLILVSMHLVVEAIRCGDNMSTMGYTDPSGDITLEVGMPLRITCVLEDKTILSSVKHPSKRMFFDQVNVELPHNKIILDDQTIQLHIPSMDKKLANNGWFHCNYRHENNNVTHICSNAVFVGTKPQAVTDFGCISYNLQNLTCTFTPPDNGISTKYHLSFSIPNTRSHRYTTNCPNLTQNGPKVNGVTQWMCVWTPESEPHYRQAVRNFDFKLSMNNTLGSNFSVFHFDHYKYVKPGPPEDLRAINSTTSSILLSFMVPSTVRTLTHGLECRLFYQCLRGPKLWKKVNIPITSNSPVTYNLTGLENAGVLCDIRVSLKLKKSTDENMWSSNSSITYSTAKAVPGAPPKMNIGSFQIDFNNKVYIYWQQIPEGLQNGGNFTYVSQAIGIDSDRPKLVELTDSYAKFENVALTKENTFAVWSRNEIGDSINKSFITIPSQSNRPRSVDSFKKLARKNGTYQVHIQRGKFSDVDVIYKEIKSYTIFWCNNHQDRPYQCQGYLNWTEVPIITNNFTVDLPNSKNFIWQFAISVNTEEYSSGMVWAVCTVLEGQPLGVIKQLKIVSYDNYGSIRLGWQLECSDAIPTIEAFIIYYCPLAEPKTPNCKEPVRNVTIFGNSEMKEGNVTGLKPYTTYKFNVAIRNKSGDIGEESDSVLGTTLESAPSSPVNLAILEDSITSTSAKVVWQPPEEMNGALKYYELHYNNKSEKVDNKSNPQYVLTNLIGYERYVVYVLACTTSCSPSSDVITFTTKIGKPSQMKLPTQQVPNISHLIVSWEPPYPPQGPLNYYQVQIRDKHEIYNTTATEYSINCEEESQLNNLYLSVRAVNVADNKEHLIGPWSEELKCYCTNPTKMVIWITIVIVVIIMIPLGYCIKRTFMRCKVMKNVELKLPPGLAPLPDWGSPKGQDEPENSPAADQELLLVKMNENRIPSGDSSGCCSGQGSVASDSGTTVSSTSDSGTEQNELRKRAKNPGPMKLRTDQANNQYISMPTTEGANKPWTPSPGNYCKFGVDPNPPVDPASVYMSAVPQPATKLPYISSDTTTPTSSYVTTGDLNKPNNSGYVPITCGEAAEKPSYVMAGTRNILVPDTSKQPEENKPIYLQASDATVKNVSDVNPWQQQMETTVPKGYVTVGEPLPNKRVAESKKGYVPHSRHFDIKLLKED